MCNPVTAQFAHHLDKLVDESLMPVSRCIHERDNASASSTICGLSLRSDYVMRLWLTGDGRHAWGILVVGCWC
jgi:hypothetical protein